MLIEDQVKDNMRTLREVGILTKDVDHIQRTKASTEDLTQFEFMLERKYCALSDF